MGVTRYLTKTQIEKLIDGMTRFKITVSKGPKGSLLEIVDTCASKMPWVLVIVRSSFKNKKEYSGQVSRLNKKIDYMIEESNKYGSTGIRRG